MKKFMWLFILILFLMTDWVVPSCSQTNNNTLVLTQTNLFSIIEEKYDYKVEKIIASMNTNLYSPEYMNIEQGRDMTVYFDDHDFIKANSEPYADFLTVSYIKTKYNGNKLVYYIERINKDYDFKGFVYLTDSHFTYEYNELKNKLLNLNIEEINNKIIPLFKDGTIYLGDEKTVPYSIIDKDKYPYASNEYSFILKNTQEKYSITIVNESIYIYNYDNWSFIYPQNMTNDKFRELYN